MIASLNICAAVHGTVDDNMAVRGKSDEGDGDQEGEAEGSCSLPKHQRVFILDETYLATEVSSRRLTWIFFTAFTGAGFSPYEVPKEMGIFHEIKRQVILHTRTRHTI